MMMTVANRAGARVGRLLLAVVLLALVGQAGAGQPATVATSVAVAAARNEVVDVLVVFDDQVPQRQLDSEVGTASVRRQVDGLEYRRGVTARARLLGAMKNDVLLAVADPDLDPVADFDQLPVSHLRVRSARALQRLRNHPGIKAVDAIQVVRPTLVQSLPLIGQPEVAAAGHIGVGTSVAVLDTGVDYTRAAFGSCSAPGGSCKVAYVQDFATPDNALDTGSYHGTNVAGIVLGVAPGTKILGLDVFEASGTANSNVLLAAINWCIANKASYNIAAINMSLGGGRHATPLVPNDSFGVAVGNAVNAGIVVVVASGNDGYSDSIAWPAAYSNVVSVGAFYDAGASERSITSFSNSASFLTLAAPGSMITAAGITMQGTSQAAPHVAGAVAVLRSVYESDSVAQLVNRLKLGAAVLDTRNGVSVPGLELTAATAIPAATYRLLVAKAGNAAGTVVSASAAIQCGATCSASINNGDSVVLTALQGAGAQFAGWTGACSGSATHCQLTMSAARSVTATFVPVAGEDFLPAGGLPRGWATSIGAQAGWAGNSETVFAGTHALKSAPVGDGQSAGISVSGHFRAGMVTFARRISAAAGDGLRFAIDGQVQATWLGEVPWGMVAFAITAGNHTLSWRYTKDGSGSAGSDAAWIDAVSLPYAATSTAQAGNDFDGDGRADVLWRHDGNGGNSLWLMDGAVRQAGSGSAPTTADTQWRIVGHADFDGDGRADILWRHVSNGSNALWLMDGISRLSSVSLPATVDPAWVVAGLADFDGDGKVDILWRNGATGDNALWLMNGSTRASAASLPRTADQAWQVVGTADVDGDGKADIVWRNAGSGANALWLMDGGTRRSSQLLPATADTAWRVVAVTDFDGDGKADVLWRNVNTGANALWLLDGATRRSTHALPTTADARWKIAAVGDFDGDGRPDLLWRHNGDGRNAMWTMDGPSRLATFTLPTAKDLNWRIVAPRTNPH